MFVELVLRQVFGKCVGRIAITKFLVELESFLSSELLKLEGLRADVPYFANANSLHNARSSLRVRKSFCFIQSKQTTTISCNP